MIENVNLRVCFCFIALFNWTICGICVTVDTNFASHTHPFTFMPVSIASLSECFSAERTFERHVIFVDPDMVTQVAQLWEFHGAQLALQNLIQSFRFRIHSVNQEVFAFILNLFFRRSKHCVTQLLLFHGALLLHAHCRVLLECASVLKMRKSMFFFNCLTSLVDTESL